MVLPGQWPMKGAFCSGNRTFPALAVDRNFHLSDADPHNVLVKVLMRARIAAAVGSIDSS